MAKKDGLTPKQHKWFIDWYGGMTQYDAYCRNYSTQNMARATIDANASRLANNAKILALKAKMDKAAEKASVASVAERKQILSQIARGEKKDIEVTTFPDGKKITKVKLMNPTPAITELNKMEGIYSDGARINIAMIQAKPIEEYTDDELEAIIEGRIKLLPEGIDND